MEKINNRNKEIINLCQLFLERALEEIKKFENNLLKREDMAWNIANIAGSLGFFDLISENRLPEDITEIIHLALDLEVPDEAYQGDAQKDTEKLINLIKVKAEEYKN